MKNDDVQFGSRPMQGRGLSDASMGTAQAGGNEGIAPGKRTLTQGMRRSDPASIMIARLHTARVWFDRITKGALPALRAATAARRMQEARTAGVELNSALARIDGELETIRRWAIVAGSAGALDFLAPLDAERDALHAEVEPMLALAPPPAPAISDEAMIDPTLAEWDVHAATEAANADEWTAKIDASQPAAAEESVQLIDASDRFGPAPVQRRASGVTHDDPEHVQRAAAGGVAGAGSPLPHLETIQRSFGAHDVSGISAHVGGAAADASRAIGAEAYATGNHVAFAESPTVFVAAHEAAHVVQQRAGVSLLGGVGVAGDAYEQHADAVAERVVRGESAEALLRDAAPGTAQPAVQRRGKNHHKDSPLVANLLAAIDGAARSALSQLDGDNADKAAELADTIVGRIDHLISIVMSPGESSDLKSLNEAAALAFGHAQELADRFASPTSVIGQPDMTAAHQWNDPRANAALVQALARVTSDLVPMSAWTWTATSSSKKVGKGFTRKVGASIVSETLDVIDARIGAVKDSTDVSPLRVTFSAVIEDLHHAAREAELVASDATAGKELRKRIKQAQTTLRAFRDRLALLKDVWAALPVDKMQDAEIRLVEAIGLPSNTVRWDDGAVNAYRAAEQLASLRERRNAGEEIAPNDQLYAQNVASEAAQAAVGAAKNVGGGEIGRLTGRLDNQIDQIAAARTKGYQDALSVLALHGKDAYQSFWMSVANGAEWLVSGTLRTGPLKMVSKTLIGAYKFVSGTSASNWNAQVKTAPSMMAGFAGGLPAGGASAQLLTAAKENMSALSTALAIAMKRDLYEDLAGAVANAPPDRDTDAQRYAADLEVSLQNALFGEVFALGLNDGEQPDSDKIAKHAQKQLLNRFIVAHAALGDDGFHAARSFRGRAEVSEAIDVLGGDDQIEVGRYELVENQIRTAAHDLGCEVDVDPDRLQKRIDAGKGGTFPVTAFDPNLVWGGGSPSRWLNPLQTDKIAQCEPHIDNEAYMGAKHLDIDSIEISADDLEERRVGGKTVYNLKRLRFVARGLKPAPQKDLFDDDGVDQSSCFVCVDMPDHFKIRYWIGP